MFLANLASFSDKIEGSRNLLDTESKVFTYGWILTASPLGASEICLPCLEFRFLGKETTCHSLMDGFSDEVDAAPLGFFAV